MGKDERKDPWQQLREAAQRKAAELETELGAGIERAGEVVRGVASTARAEVSRVEAEYRVTEQIREVVSEVGGKAEAQREQFEQTARDILGAARSYYEGAERAAATSTRLANAGVATADAIGRARAWFRENPGKATVLSLSMLAGARAGAALPALGVTILGTGGAGHWLFHSALPIVGLRPLARQMERRLEAQRELLRHGDLEQAERERIELERDLLRYVGAPLLGAFSVAAGATMIGAAFSGATATGAPISLLLGPTPLLHAVWFFANGVICIREGYDFFMIALAEEEEVVRLVREIKGLLPPATPATPATPAS
ncbi:MAG: hypothetical protein ACOYNR_06125 [Blastocatellia bacterium]